MKLQLADGYEERPVGLLEKVIVTSCGVEYEQTFAVVDFGLNPNYDIILGRPFMRQLKMIQDWGFNYIYLGQEDAITRINLADHSYRDVARTPIEDFESATAMDKSTRPSRESFEMLLWMCGASECGSEGKAECTKDRESQDEAYIPEPFLEAKLQPDGWQDVLATVDVCVNEVTPTVFCDEEGYDLTPFHMIRVITNNVENMEESKEQAHKRKIREVLKRIEVPIISQQNGEIEEDPDCLRPYICIEIGNTRISHCALIDSRADLNSLSYDTWDNIGQPPLTYSKTQVGTFVGDHSTVVGLIELPLFIGKCNSNLVHKFYVMKPGTMLTPVILGQPWQRKYNCRPDWKREGVLFTAKNMKVFEPFLSKECYHDTESDASVDEEPVPKLPQRQQQPSTSQVSAIQVEQVQEKKPLVHQGKVNSWRPNSYQTWVPKKLIQAQRDNKFIWIPKQKCITHPQVPKQARSTTGRQRKSKIKKKPLLTSNYVPTALYSFRWIPKKALQAQGYHEGARYIWLPKQFKTSSILSPQVQVQMPKTATVTGQQWKPKASSTTLQKEVPKTDKQLQKPSMDKPKQKAIRQEKGKWVPKTSSILKHTLTVTEPTSKLSSTDATNVNTPTSQQASSPSYKLTGKAQQFASNIFGYNRLDILHKLEDIFAPRAENDKNH
jgi:hypothetical protein